MRKYSKPYLAFKLALMLSISACASDQTVADKPTRVPSTQSQQQLSAELKDLSQVKKGFTMADFNAYGEAYDRALSRFSKSKCPELLFIDVVKSMVSIKRNSFFKDEYNVFQSLFEGMDTVYSKCPDMVKSVLDSSRVISDAKLRSEFKRELCSQLRENAEGQDPKNPSFKNAWCDK